jgi:uncharacterized iron-regulated protein
MESPRRTLALLALAACAACATPRPVSIVTAVDDLATRDVVFLGEEHDNGAGHRAQHALLLLLHAERPELVVSMEMFERDVQPVLDRYLAGEIDEAALKQDARPWPNYVEHYRPIVEYCKARGIPVVAANLPRKLAQKVGAEGIAAVAGDPNAAAATTAPKDEYWQRFRDAMAEHAGNDGGKALERFYVTQCLKDDTMAESIARALAAGERPLVVHLNGKFHSDRRLGTAARLLARRPQATVGVVSMQVDPDVDGPQLVRGAGGTDYVLLVPPEPPKAVPAPAPGPAKPAGAPQAPPAEGRPALGLMPDYESEDGLAVEMVVEGGPAATAGIRAGDVIVELDGEPIADVRSYMSVLGDLRIGSKVRVVLQRDGTRIEKQVEVGSR